MARGEIHNLKTGEAWCALHFAAGEEPLRRIELSTSCLNPRFMRNMLDMVDLALTLARRRVPRVARTPSDAMTPPVEAWRYWGRTGGTGRIVAVLRLPRDRYDGRLTFEHFAAMERLRPDGSWSRDAVASALAEKDWMHGWFDEADEIDASTVAALLLAWNARDAPDPRSHRG